MYYYYQCDQAERNPNYWCYDDWTCPNSGATGLASSIYGPNSPLADACTNCDGEPGSSGCSGCTCTWEDGSLSPACTSITYTPGPYVPGPSGGSS